MTDLTSRDSDRTGGNNNSTPTVRVSHIYVLSSYRLYTIVHVHLGDSSRRQDETEGAPTAPFARHDGRGLETEDRQLKVRQGGLGAFEKAQPSAQAAQDSQGNCSTGGWRK